jgi:hypothetical protein
MTIYAIGDIHGHLDKLRTRMTWSRPTARARDLPTRRLSTWAIWSTVARTAPGSSRV